MLSGDPYDGWFPVEKVLKQPVQAEEDDPSIWVLFSKNLGAESIQVRLPGDPTYQYVDSDTLEISSTQDGETFQLVIQPGRTADLGGDSVYELAGKWVHEQVVQTEHHVYLFKTITKGADSESAQIFFSSFSIEENR